MSRISSWQGSIRFNLKRRSDTELEQALVRLAISILVSLYLLYHVIYQETHNLDWGLFVFIGACIIIALIIIISILIYPQISPVRRSLGIVSDMVAISYSLNLANEGGAVIFFLYLWVVVGNGLRFGKPYLFGAMAAAIAGFSYVAMTNSYWQENSSVAYGILISFIALPLYFSVLLSRLQEAKQSLEDRVETRTIELAIERNKALAANHAKSHFLTHMSHELRTPLNAIIGYSEMLAEDAEISGEKNTLADLQKIKKSGRHLLDMISNILDLTKIEAGKVTVNRRHVELRPFIEDLRDIIGPFLETNNNQLVIKFANEDLNVFVDEIQLRQILLNLMSNAAKFTVNGLIHLHIELVSDGDDNILLIDVKDNGIGIAQHNLSKIFKPFVQVDEAYTRHHDGSGLGLAISQNLCEMMGGRIEVQSTLGQGATFSLVLPLHSPQSNPLSSEEATTSKMV